MLSLKELKDQYQKGIISKHEYIEKMHSIHEYLFQYADFIKDTNIGKIEIRDGEVIMTSKYPEISMFCDKSDKRTIQIEALNFGFRDKEELDIILKLLNNKSTVLDIGANLGWYSLSLAKLLDGIKIYAFEPVSPTFLSLQENVALNNLKNINLFNYGFLEEAQEIELYYQPEHSGASSMKNILNSNQAQKIPCSFKKLDDFVSENNLKVDFIKCDVEGAELFVVKGGFKTLKEQKPILLMELHRKWCDKFNYHPNEIINMLDSINYSCYRIEKDKLVKQGLIDESVVEVNFLFINKETKIEDGIIL